MKRRQFLLLTLTAPLAARRLFADTSAPPAMRAAAVIGPTLFIIKPRDSALRVARGKLFGELLTEVPDALLAPLGGMALMAVTMDELRAAFPVGDGEPLAVYVDARRDLVVRRLEVARKAAHPDIERVIGFLREVSPPASDAARVGREARARYTREVPGARWASETGCGTLVPGEEDQMPDCGMGHGNARARRFLWFFAKGEKRPM